MDFASRGLSWAGNIYQTLENIHLNDILGQNPSKFVDEFGENFRQIIDEVDDWLNPSSDGCVKEPDLLLEHDVGTELCKKSKIELDNISSNEKLPPYTELKSDLSSEEYLSLGTSPDVPQDLSHEKACDALNTKSASTSAEVSVLNCSFEEGENRNFFFDPVASHANLLDSLLTADEVLPYESHQNKVMEKGLMLSGCDLLGEISGTYGTHESMSLLDSFESEYTQQSGPNRLVESLQSPEDAFIESSDNFDREEALGGSDLVDMNKELLEEFEDVKLEQCWDDTEKDKLVLIPQQPIKNMSSYKKKLRDTFLSKVWSSKKDCEQIEIWHHGTDSEMSKRRGFTASSVSCRSFSSINLPTHDSGDSDWELL